MTTSSDDPHFVLADRRGIVTASGVEARYDDPHVAADALRARDVDAVVGALPFDLADRAALTAPSVLGRGGHLPEVRPLPPLRQVAEVPEPGEHLDRVRRAVALIGSGELRKVVLARAVDFESAAPVRPLDLVAALRSRDDRGNAFGVALAGGDPASPWLVGSSPEVLVERHGDRVSCHPYAGTAAEPDGLFDSAKDREEHAYVVDEIATALAPVCCDLEIPAEPSVTRAGPVWHLGTRIEGRVNDSSVTALDLALALHPTAAVCGVPKQSAAKAIASFEGERRFYAGAVGWTNSRGDGHWRVAIRCAEVGVDRTSLRAFAGGGIVAHSDPDAEFAETENKLRAVLGPFSLIESVRR
ncbi:isochorismate synthase [Gordonia shandongensis]|uniref:isochorismate synthase n=1 Tax=Gordonia shandongensis TaxID=376351 RepID=UPI0003FE9507|nr:chorismate-binding protein [Gordonia shandongensis]